jgi:NAD(P)H dehydrogenase (quinone)
VHEPQKVLILGDSRIKIATALFLASIAKSTISGKPEVIVGTSSVTGTKNNSLVKAGIPLIACDFHDKNSVFEVIKAADPDVVYLATPANEDRTSQSVAVLTACKRLACGHVVILSTTLLDRKENSVFADQCKPIEKYVKSSGISYTILRLPILLDNYLSQYQAIVDFGVYYRPLAPNVTRNAIAIRDVAEASARVLMSPAKYVNQTLSLNGPLNSDSLAVEAFSKALSRPIVYEQISYDNYRQTLVRAKMATYQVRIINRIYEHSLNNSFVECLLIIYYRTD